MEKINPNSLPFIYTDTVYAIDTKSKNQSSKQLEEPLKKEAPTSQNTPPKIEIQILGENTTGVLILSNESGSPFLSANDFAFLEKIIQATGHKLSDSAIVNTFRKTHTLQEILEHTQCKSVITFGVNLFEIGLKDTAPLNYECTEQLNGSIKLIPSEQLHLVAGNSDKKKALWIALKRMFAI